MPLSPYAAANSAHAGKNSGRLVHSASSFHPQICRTPPGHPLLDSVLDLTLERNRDLLRRGTVLVDERDASDTPRVLFYLEHAIQDASLTRAGERRVVSKQ